HLQMELLWKGLSLKCLHKTKHNLINRFKLHPFLFCIFLHLVIFCIFSLQTGNFFGEIEGAVMNKLLTMGSFKRITLYDYQAMCRTNKESSDSAHRLDPGVWCRCSGCGTKAIN
uniref:Voltage-dependent calcium channel alpha-2/delta subunit conserved region domain-containing protein n=1 Tax=Pavo cristatus TaxID=9049 RepID=A0A8C9FP47_PAVCR